MALCNACSTAPGLHARNRLGHRFAHLGQAAASSTLTAMSNRLQAVLLLVPRCSSGLQWLIVSCRASSAYVVCFLSLFMCVSWGRDGRRRAGRKTNCCCWQGEGQEVQFCRTC